MKDILPLTSMDTLWHNYTTVFPSQPLSCSTIKRLLLFVAENEAPSGRAGTTGMMTMLIHMVCCVEVKGKGMVQCPRRQKADQGTFMPEAFKAPAELSRSCRALRSLDSTLLACSSKRPRRQRPPLPHPPTVAPTLHPPSILLSAPPLTQQISSWYLSRARAG
jgi:hypothetical protein